MELPICQFHFSPFFMIIHLGHSWFMLEIYNFIPTSFDEIYEHIYELSPIMAQSKLLYLISVSTSYSYFHSKNHLTTDIKALINWHQPLHRYPKLTCVVADILLFVNWHFSHDDTSRSWWTWYNCYLQFSLCIQYYTISCGQIWTNLATAKYSSTAFIITSSAFLWSNLFSLVSNILSNILPGTRQFYLPK